MLRMLSFNKAVHSYITLFLYIMAYTKAVLSGQFPELFIMKDICARIFY